jgi:hypothetical protein
MAELSLLVESFAVGKGVAATPQERGPILRNNT